MDENNFATMNLIVTSFIITSEQPVKCLKPVVHCKLFNLKLNQIKVYVHIYIFVTVSFKIIPEEGWEINSE